MTTSDKVLIVGGGLAGLNCALHLKRAGLPVLVMEAADAVGGRIRTDFVDGFRLDRGFQVLLTAYPEAQHVLDYKQLELRPFLPGALVRYQGRFHRVADPIRNPELILDTVTAPIGTLADKLRIAKLRLKSGGTPSEGAPTGGAVLQRSRTGKNGESQSTLQLLRESGFSEAIIERFFRPFFGGVFLQSDLCTSSRNFEFLFKMFADGDTAIPANGMEEIPKQLARQLGPENIWLKSKVIGVVDDSVVLATGERLRSPYIVMATEAHVLTELLYDMESATIDNAVSCLYFATEGPPPVSDPILVLNGEGKGVINNLCVPSVVSPAYAPAGQSLISVTVLGTSMSEPVLRRKVQEELADWFGPQTADWRHLRTYMIKHALPRQTSDTMHGPVPNYLIREGLYACGDHMSIGSINGALESGRRVAQLIAARCAYPQERVAG